MENPAPSTPPTDGQILLETLRRLGLIDTPKHMNAVQRIKQFCKLLSAYNVKTVHAEYDGSGDSGDFYDITAVVASTPEELDTTPAALDRPRSLKTFLEEKAFDKPQTLITRDQYDEFYDDLFSLLPGGWEISDGSFGSIDVDVLTEAISMEHNERVTDVNTSNFNY